MVFLLGCVQAVSSALGLAVDKKIVAHRSVGSEWQALLYRFVQLLVLAPLLALGVLSFPNGFAPLWEPWTLAMFAASIGLLFASYPFRRAAYMNEKVTVLQPFAMSKQVFSVIVAFVFISQERANPWPFVFALVALAAIVFSQVGKSGLKFNKWSLTLTAGMAILTAQSFFTLGFVKMLGGSPYYFAEGVALVALNCLVLAGTGKWKQGKTIDRKWLAMMAGNALLGLVSVLIILELYRSHGMVASNLVQLLYVAFVFVFSWFLLGEKPTAKDIAVSAVVAGCVAAGTFLK